MAVIYGKKNDRTTYAIRYLLLTRFLGISVIDLFNTKLGFKDEDENNIDAYQELWDQRLIELTQSGLSIREIADILKSSTKTIRKAIDRLGIEPFGNSMVEGNTFVRNILIPKNLR